MDKAGMRQEGIFRAARKNNLGICDEVWHAIIRRDRKEQMNYFVEGLQGSGKSTLSTKIAKKYPGLEAVHEGDYSPVELAWCAYVSLDEYREILEKYSDIRTSIEEKSHAENGQVVICYTQVITDTPGFHKDLEQYEIYNGRLPVDEFERIVLTRFMDWNGKGMIFECSLFQNIVEDMLLFRDASDQEIIQFYKKIEKTLQGKEYKILYLETEDIAANIDVIRRERSDDQGNELWFPMMCRYFDESPYAKKRGVSGEKALREHFAHRQALELRICREVFPGMVTVLKSKQYGDDEV